MAVDPVAGESATAAIRAGGRVRALGPVAFLVRVVHEEDGGLSGIVERLRTGHKERFREVTALGALISLMLDAPPIVPGNDPNEIADHARGVRPCRTP